MATLLGVGDTPVLMMTPARYITRTTHSLRARYPARHQPSFPPPPASLLLAACSPPSHSLNPPLHYASADDCSRCPSPHAPYTHNYLCVRITSDRARHFICASLSVKTVAYLLSLIGSLFAGLPVWIPLFRRLRAVFLPGVGRSDRGVTIISFSMLCTLSDLASFYTF